MATHFPTHKHEVWLPYKFSMGPAYKRFYEGLMEEKILGNKCPECSKVFVPARTFCPKCFIDMEDWVEVSQEGEVVTWMVANDGFFGMPADPPFIGALIRLEGTACNFLHLIGGLDLTNEDVLRNKLKPGTRVRAIWSEEKKGHLMDIKCFMPI